MFVYFHWSKNGNNHVQAFHKVDKAADYVINQIEAYAIDEGKSLALKKKRSAYHDGDGDFGALPVVPPVPVQWFADNPFPNAAGGVAVAGAPEEKKKEEKKVPIELTLLREHMDIAKKNRTFENAQKAIELYEDFLRYALNNESAIHALTDLKIVE